MTTAQMLRNRHRRQKSRLRFALAAKQAKKLRKQVAKAPGAGAPDPAGLQAAAEGFSRRRSSR
jgi:hypothetical protein